MEEEDCATLDKNIMDKTSATLKRSKFTSLSLRKSSGKKERSFYPQLLKEKDHGEERSFQRSAS